MRLLLITNVFPNPTQPTRGTFNLEMTRALCQLGHQIDVVSPVSWVEEWQAWRKGRKIGRKRHEVVHGMHVYYPRFYYTPKLLRSCYGWLLWHSIRDTVLPLARANQPDAIVSYWAHPDGYVGLRLAGLINRPCVVVIGGSDVLLLCRRSGRRRCVLNVLDAVDAVIVVSRDLKDKVGQLGVDPGKVHVGWRGVDAEKFCPGDRPEARRRLGLPQDRPLLLFVGNFVPVKNIETLLAAAAILRARATDFQLLLVGRGPLENTLRRKCHALGLEEHVRFVGPVPHDALPDWYRAVDLTVLPSWSEGVPNVLLESSAAGVPFVASRVGGIPEIAAEGIDCLVPAGDPPALADAVAQQLSRGKRTSAPARTLFSWPDSAREATCLIEKLRAGGDLRRDPLLCSAATTSSQEAKNA
jgi:glycosyltransferase involved in cell wall biosynthesis